jgi:hypothetical protein
MGMQITISRADAISAAKYSPYEAYYSVSCFRCRSYTALHSAELNSATTVALNSPLNNALQIQHRSRRNRTGALGQRLSNGGEN